MRGLLIREQPRGYRSSGAGGSAVAGPKSYSTNFDATENPVSEGGVWTRTDTLSSPMRSSGGICFGTQTGSDGYDDSQAALSGFGSRVRSTAVLSRSASIGSLNHEIELTFRGTETSTTTKKYEVLMNKDGSLQFMRWIGGHGFDQFTDLGIFAGTNSISTPADGLIFTAECETVSAGTVELRFYTGTSTFVGSARDDGSFGGAAYLTGQPGIGNFISDPASNPAHFCFSSLTVADF